MLVQHLPHQLDLVEKLCDRLVILSRGRVVAAGTPDELQGQQRLRHRLVLAGDAAWVAGIPGIDAVEIHHDRANVRSAAVPRRLGFTFVGEEPDEPEAPGEAGIDCAWRAERAAWTAGR